MSQASGRRGELKQRLEVAVQDLRVGPSIRLTSRELREACELGTAAIDAPFELSVATVRRALALEIVTSWYATRDQHPIPSALYRNLRSSVHGHWAWDWVSGHAGKEITRGERLVVQQEAVTFASETIGVLEAEHLRALEPRRRTVGFGALQLRGSLDLQVDDPRGQRGGVFVRDHRTAGDEDRALAFEAVVAIVGGGDLDWVGRIDIEVGAAHRRRIDDELLDEGICAIQSAARRVLRLRELRGQLGGGEVPEAAWSRVRPGYQCRICPLAPRCPAYSGGAAVSSV